MARSINTPLFCRLRNLLDNVDGEGYYSIPWEESLNCTVSWVEDLCIYALALQPQDLVEQCKLPTSLRRRDCGTAPGVNHDIEQLQRH